MRQLPPLNPLMAFEAAARHLSFTKAAKELNVTQGAISRQVHALEAFFGAPLFDRRGRGIDLAASAKSYGAAVIHAFEELRAATNAYAMTSERSTLTLKGYALLLHRWLMPKLPDFKKQCPKIDVRLIGTSGASHVDFVKDGVDVGIRYGRGRWEGLTSHLLFRDELVPVCAPEFAVQHRLEAAEQVKDLVLLQTYARADDWTDWLKLTRGKAAVSERLSFEDLSVVHRCALDGMGIAILQKCYVDEDFVSGRLVAPFETVLHRQVGYYLVYPTSRADVPEISAFRKWLMETV